MNIQDWLIKHQNILEKVLFINLLIFVVVILVYPPIHHGFTYATGGDDTASHIRYLTALTDDISFVGNLPYYGNVLLTPFTYLGISPITVFNIFNFAVIPGIFIALWVLVRRYYGLAAAILSFYISVFIVRGTWFYFNDGTIFNIFNLFVVGIFAIYCLCRWLESGKYRWLIATGLLFIASSLIHNTTYLYIMASMLFFTTGFSILQYYKKDMLLLKKTLIFGGVFVISILTAWITWMHTMLPTYSSAVAGTITQGESPMAGPVTPAFFVEQDLNVGMLFIIALTLVVSILVLKRGKPEDRGEITKSLNQPLSYILLSFTIVLAVGAFTLLGHNSERFSRDLATFVGLETAIVLGLALTHYRLKFKKLIILTIAFLLLTVNIPMHYWTGDYTAVRLCDRQAIELLNSLDDDTIEVQASNTVATWILELYTNDNIHLERVANWDNYLDADYLVYRNNHMTWGTGNREFPDSSYVENNGMITEIAKFQTDINIVTIYKVLHPE